MSENSVLKNSQPGNTQADRTKAAEYKARVERLKEENEIANASGNQPMSNKYIEAFDKNKVNETPTGVYVKATRYASPIRTKKGGKPRKHRGSRKNKKSRRR